MSGQQLFCQDLTSSGKGALPAGVAWGGLAGSKGSVTVPEGDQVPFQEVMRGTSGISPVPSGAEDAVRVDSFRWAADV